MSDSLDRLREFAADAVGGPVSDFTALPGGGSSREFYRFQHHGGSAVGVIASQPAEALAFLEFTHHFAEQGIPVPHIVGALPDGRLYIMEDLGDETLADRLAVWAEQPDGEAAADQTLAEVLGWLAKIQVRGGAGLNYALCPEGPEMSANLFHADAALFLEYYLPHQAPGMLPPQQALRELEALAERLGALPRDHFCYRDFQGRNIMWREGAPVFLDYQSGRRGPLAYDLASLLYSPDTLLDDARRKQLIFGYLAALDEEGVAMDEENFRAAFFDVVLLRRLQSLGAYVRMAVNHGKTERLARIPAAWATLRDLLERHVICPEAPALRDWLLQLAE